MIYLPMMPYIMCTCRSWIRIYRNGWMITFPRYCTMPYRSWITSCEALFFGIAHNMLLLLVLPTYDTRERMKGIEIHWANKLILHIAVCYSGKFATTVMRSSHESWLYKRFLCFILPFRIFFLLSQRNFTAIVCVLHHSYSFEFLNA